MNIYRGQIYNKLSMTIRRQLWLAASLMVVDLVITGDWEMFKEVRDKWRRWAEAKVRIQRSNILPGGDTQGETL